MKLHNIQISGSIKNNGEDLTQISSSVATVTSNLGSRISSLEANSGSINNKTGSFATTGSNTFIGAQTFSGSIIPSVDSIYDLGNSTHQFRHLYLSSASLYIDGVKVLGSTAQELQITTDVGQSFKILEAGSDTITLQSADGNITLASSGGGDIILDPTSGVIALKGTVTLYSGNRILSSDGNPIHIGEGLVITGSVVATGTALISGSAQVQYGGITGIPSGIVSGSSQLTGSYDARYVLSGSITQTTWDNIASKPTGIVSGSIQVDITGTTGYSTFSSSISGSIGALSSSVATTTSGLSSSIGSVSSSVATTTNNLSSSIGSLSSSVATTTLNTSSSLNSISGALSASIVSLSGSVATTTSGLSSSIGSLSASIATTDRGQNTRIGALEDLTGSYATTGSNKFNGNQTITGSVIITQNLTVFGSSSITYVTSSQLRIDDNVITLNTSTPGQRFGGIEVYDSGSITQATGSILWDSVNNRWIYQQSSEATYGGGVLMSGPRSSGSLGSELTLTSGRVAKSAGGDHLNDSNITDDGTLVSINSNTEVTGTLKITGTIVSSGTSIFSGSGQVIAALPAGTVSGSSQVLSGTGIWSGSAQLPANVVSSSTQVVAYLPTGTVSGSSQVLSGTGIWSGSAQLPSGTVSSSAQTVANLPAGTVSGSSQVLAGTTIHSGSFFNGITVVSGSAQVDFTGIINKPTLVSGSSQITFGSISGLPTLVSGSSQITFGSLSSIPSGLVSGSSQVLSGTGIWSGSAQLPSGVVSGSAQIVASLPAGTVSGSLQITLSSTTGFSTYLDQAVKSGSTVTFSSVTATISGGGSAAAFIGQGFSQYYSTGGADQKYWDILASGGLLSFRAVNDANSSATNYMTISRGTGTAITTVNFPNGNVSITGTVGASNFSGTHSGTSSGTNTGDQTNISGYATSLNGYANQTLYTILDGPANGPVIKVRYDGATANRYIDIGSKDGNNAYTEGLKIYDGSTLTFRTYTVYHSGNVPTWNQNTSGTASNITAYTINQSVGTGNSPTFTNLYSTTNLSTGYGTTVTGSDNGLNIFAGSDASGYGRIRFYFNGTNQSTIHAFSNSWSTNFSSGSRGAININGQNGVTFGGWNAPAAYIDNAGISYFASTMTVNGILQPNITATYTLGTSSLRWGTIYTNDLSLKNDYGDYTIVEGAEKLYLYNNKNNKVYSFVLQEEDPATAAPKKYLD